MKVIPIVIATLAYGGLMCWVGYQQGLRHLAEHVVSERHIDGSGAGGSMES